MSGILDVSYTSLRGTLGQHRARGYGAHRRQASACGAALAARRPSPLRARAIARAPGGAFGATFPASARRAVPGLEAQAQAPDQRSVRAQVHVRPPRRHLHRAWSPWKERRRSSQMSRARCGARG
eukprot:scaffold13923_cov26-Tisochrysis_lutea.AAC.3